MKRTYYLFSLLAIGLFALCLAVGCGRTEHVGARADSLRPALLGGYYFYRGVGGVDALLNYADRAGEDNFSACAELLSNPYEDNSRRELAQLLREAWGVTDRATLYSHLSKLSDSQSAHKAWDYARAVNLSWMGCALGWMSRAEMKGYQQALMERAQQHYPDWKAYYADFLAGRAAWDKKDEVGDRKLSELLVHEMLHHPSSIYHDVSLQ